MTAYSPDIQRQGMQQAEFFDLQRLQNAARILLAESSLRGAAEEVVSAESITLWVQVARPEIDDDWFTQLNPALSLAKVR